MNRYSFSLLALLLSGCAYDVADKVSDPQPVCVTPALVSYSQNIQPLLTRNCLSCHSAALRSGAVNLEDYTELSQRAASGQLLGVVKHSPGYLQMPKDGAKLSACDIALLEKWVDAGAPQN
ncbi:hypothetical protein [Hymenobacter sp. DG25B]|uniref:hypothetical protein n=1 Tax=Hymenobacter sp. DG25B TaxID=1385664 RepID=UPI0006621926|nr:hypothetical protein [Hymenobacter sp. DG25B]